MKSIFRFLTLLVAGAAVTACSEKEPAVTPGDPYWLTGNLWHGETAADSTVTLIIDRHAPILTTSGDTLPATETVILPVAEGKFSYRGTPPTDADELYLYDSQGHVAHLYGLSGLHLQLDIDSLGTVSVTGYETADPLYRTLVIRDSISLMQDSLRVRRMLGSIPASAKPEWLMLSIGDQLDRQWLEVGRRTRLQRMSIPVGDTLYQLPNNKPESVVMLFWSPEVPASQDSLVVLRQIARDYGLYDFADKFTKEKSATRSNKIHRMELLSVCVSATDKSSWESAVKDIPGKHSLLTGGLAHPLATTFQVHQLPTIVVVDRFGNYQCHNLWGKPLYKVLEKSPNNTELNRKYKL